MFETATDSNPQSTQMSPELDSQCEEAIVKKPKDLVPADCRNTTQLYERLVSGHLFITEIRLLPDRLDGNSAVGKTEVPGPGLPSLWLCTSLVLDDQPVLCQFTTDFRPVWKILFTLRLWHP